MAEAGYNAFLLRSEDVFIDLLTNSVRKGAAGCVDELLYGLDVLIGRARLDENDLYLAPVESPSGPAFAVAWKEAAWH